MYNDSFWETHLNYVYTNTVNHPPRFWPVTIVSRPIGYKSWLHSQTYYSHIIDKPFAKRDYYFFYLKKSNHIQSPDCKNNSIADSYLSIYKILFKTSDRYKSIIIKKKIIINLCPQFLNASEKNECFFFHWDILYNNTKYNSIIFLLHLLSI